ncbi:MAG TPA: sugar nucleotide-binding protein [Stellaceae bacterium]|nr:sugar nucleotide-binding protein [Stellaceae bacterium]
MVLLLFGATGLLGQAIRAETARRKIDTVGIARKGADHALDLTQASCVTSLFAAVRPHLVINAAAQTNIDACERDPGDAYQINARAVAFIAEECRAADIPFAQISTDHYFVGHADRRHTETAAVTLVNEYARTKYAGEAFALTYDRALVVRTNITGFRGWAGQPTFAEWALDALATRKPLRLFADCHSSTIDVTSFAHALFDLLARGATGVINVASRTTSSKRQFVQTLARSIGIDLDWDEPGSVHSLPTCRADSLGLDVTLAESLLGYRLPTLEDICHSLASQWTSRQCAMTPA